MIIWLKFLNLTRTTSNTSSRSSFTRANCRSTSRAATSGTQYGLLQQGRGTSPGKTQTTSPPSGKTLHRPRSLRKMANHSRQPTQRHRIHNPQKTSPPCRPNPRPRSCRLPSWRTQSAIMSTKTGNSFDDRFLLSCFSNILIRIQTEATGPTFWRMNQRCSHQVSSYVPIGQTLSAAVKLLAISAPQELIP